MKTTRLISGFAALLATISMSTALAQTTPGTAKAAAFHFAGTGYFHRFSSNDQHEYTPSGQEDLNKWSDMVTVVQYRQATDGEALAAIANNVLAKYKSHNAKVIKTDSVPRTATKPAEHLIVVAFGRPEFIEVAFTRLRMHQGVGMSVVYSHRLYGTNVGQAMGDWLKQNGANTERALMSWDVVYRPLNGQALSRLH